MAPLEEAFGERFAPEEWADELAVIEPDRSMAAFDGETPVGFASAYTFRLTIPGGELPAGGLTAVGVLPTHRRRGILRSMMERHFADCRGRGEPVSILWASEGAIYQRFGYGPGTLSRAGSRSPARGRPSAGRWSPSVGSGSSTSRPASRLIPPLYERIRRTVPGSLDRSDDDWRLRHLADAEYRRAADGPKSVVVYEEDGDALGYAIVRRKAEWNERGPNGAPDGARGDRRHASGDPRALGLAPRRRPDRPDPGLPPTAPAPAPAAAGRAAPAGPDRGRRDLAPAARRRRGARPAVVRRAWDARPRRPRRRLPVERRPLAV